MATPTTSAKTKPRTILLTLQRLIHGYKNIAADIITVPEVERKPQEAKKIDQMKTIANANNYHYAFGKAIYFDGGEYGLGILSKYKIAKTQVIPLPSGKAEQCMALITHIDVPGFDSPVLFIATHFDWQKDQTLHIEKAHKIMDIIIGDTKYGF
ncbi:endonuclease/exonuclease/phosphatase family protein [Sodalis-like endosymbiont of Proechinophthirus fluctus]|uniref:endonuclease/exonuclease/phosphatase family protein n=1 Tax=Sodalis-like endosymbiont of Proechinophthirus fluctus TaxID=1462730 RepID=UPI00082E90E0